MGLLSLIIEEDKEKGRQVVRVKLAQPKKTSILRLTRSKRVERISIAGEKVPTLSRSQIYSCLGLKLDSKASAKPTRKYILENCAKKLNDVTAWGFTAKEIDVAVQYKFHSLYQHLGAANWINDSFLHQLNAVIRTKICHKYQFTLHRDFDYQWIFSKKFGLGITAPSAQAEISLVRTFINLSSLNNEIGTNLRRQFHESLIRMHYLKHDRTVNTYCERILYTSYTSTISF